MSAECVDTCAHTCAAYVPSGLGCGFEEFRASPDAWAHKTWAASVDLYNESHLDSGDGERCWAIWTRAHPQPPARGQAGLMWYLAVGSARQEATRAGWREVVRSGLLIWCVAFRSSDDFYIKFCSSV